MADDARNLADVLRRLRWDLDNLQGAVRRGGGGGGGGTPGPPGQPGQPGAAAGFGTPAASASGLPAGAAPTASVTASGPDTAKIFDFAFGIPAGAQGPPGGGATLPTTTRVSFSQSATFATWDMIGIVPPPSAFHTRGTSQVTNDLMTALKDCLVTFSWFTHSGPDGLIWVYDDSTWWEAYFPALPASWGGLWIAGSLTRALRTGERLLVDYYAGQGGAHDVRYWLTFEERQIA